MILGAHTSATSKTKSAFAPVWTGVVVAVCTMAAWSGASLAVEKPSAKNTGKQETASPKPTPLPEAPRGETLAAQYCASIRDVAAEARFAFQASQLEALAKQVDEKLTRLEERGAELKSWIAAREAFMNRASNQLVGIYSNMRPESASEQLVRLEPMTAAAIIAKLDPRAASAILNDMPADKAARLTSILVGASRSSDAKGPR